MPEPTEAMVEAAMQVELNFSIVGDDGSRRGEVKGSKLSADASRRILSAALAVSPGCRGAELAHAAENVIRDAEQRVEDVVWVPEASMEALVEALAAYRGSGGAGFYSHHINDESELAKPLDASGEAGPE